MKNMMSVYSEAEDLINIGAYKSGANPEIDAAVRLRPMIQNFLRQPPEENSDYNETLKKLSNIMTSRRT
jgi:flagellum-specific ATP synthase